MTKRDNKWIKNKVTKDENKNKGRETRKPK